MITKTPTIPTAPSTIAYSIAKDVLERLWSNVVTDSSEKIAIIQFEASCWLDSLTSEILDEFCSLLHKSQSNIATALVSVAASWKESKLPSPVPSLQFSSLFVYSILSIQHGINSIAFVRCFCQVATNLILFMHNPLSLASIILTSSQPEITVDMYQVLVLYCQSLVRYDSHTDSIRSKCLKDLLQSVFTEQSPLNLLAVPVEPQDETDLSFVSLPRQLAHIFLISDNLEDQNKCIALIQKLLPATLQVSFECSITNLMTSAVFKTFN
jgi:hypothetical protein